jgi:hypothetical protein
MEMMKRETMKMKMRKKDGEMKEAIKIMLNEA